MNRAKVITGTGSYLPERVITNEEIERASRDFDRARSGVSLDQWCRTRMGAVSRRRAAAGEGTSDMATRAAQRAMDLAGVGPDDIDVLVLGTITSDHRVPPSAALVQASLKTRARFLQVDSACTGFLDALMVADGLLDRLDAKTALVMGADVMSHYMDPERFRTQAIFGDGAGAAVLQVIDANGKGVRAYSTGSSGADGHLVNVWAGGVKRPITPEVLERGEQYMEMALGVIPAYGVDKMVRATREALDRAGIGVDDVDWVVPHQASTNIVHDTAKALGVGLSRFILNFDRVGNTSAASIPIALDEANRAGCFADGDTVVMPAVGAGMAWGAAVAVWHDPRGSAAS